MPLQNNLCRQPARRHLRFHAEFRGFEGVGLRHRGLGAVEAVEDELTKELVADLTGDIDVLHGFVVREVEVAATFFAGEIEIFSQLDEALRAEDERAAVAECGHRIGREPVDANVLGRAVVGEEIGLAEVLEPWSFFLKLEVRDA